MLRADDMLHPRAGEALHTDTTTTTTIPTVSPATFHGHFLPGNPMPYLAPSAAHQPELLLLTWMLHTIASLIDNLRYHPLVHDPNPPMSSPTHRPTGCTSNYATAYVTSSTPQMKLSAGLAFYISFPDLLAPQDIIAWIQRLLFTRAKPITFPVLPYCHNQYSLTRCHHRHHTTPTIHSTSSTPPTPQPFSLQRAPPTYLSNKSPLQRSVTATTHQH